MNSNIPPFYIGQKVVYITGDNMPKNSIHTITALHQRKCGCWILAINGVDFKYDSKHSIDINTITYCPEHNIKWSSSQEDLIIGWCATSFRPLAETKLQLISYERVLIEQPVSAN